MTSKKQSKNVNKKLIIVAKCSKCDSPIYGPREIASTQQPEIKRTCICSPTYPFYWYYNSQVTFTPLSQPIFKPSLFPLTYNHQPSLDLVYQSDIDSSKSLGTTSLVVGDPFSTSIS